MKRRRSLSERLRALDAELERARRSIERTARVMCRRAAPPIAGDILFEPGSAEPEVLVIERGCAEGEWWVAKLDDEDASVVFEDELAGAVARSLSWSLVRSDALCSMRRSGVLSAGRLELVRSARWFARLR